MNNFDVSGVVEPIAAREYISEIAINQKLTTMYWGIKTFFVREWKGFIFIKVTDQSQSIGLQISESFK